MQTENYLSFSYLRKIISKRLNEIPEYRKADNVVYSIHDTSMAGLAMMYFQDPSLLQFQERLEDGLHNNNLKTLFNIEKIPKSTQMRDILDEIDRKNYEPIFEDIFMCLQSGKYLEEYKFLGDYYLISIDGSGYFSSEKICCPGCLTKKGKGKSGKIRYEHQILQAALMHPDKRCVIPLAPEGITNSDGEDKQDCETKGGKRLIGKIRNSHPKLNIIIVGDSLYSKQPFIEELEDKEMSYILVVKEGDHKLLMEWVNEQRQLGEVKRLKIKDIKGRLHIYEWINEVPLNGNKKTKWVNYFEYWIIDISTKKINYHNSWVTDITIGEDNVVELVKGGRCRWKIENENFNTLKNQGYDIEHNYGHGKKNLAMNFFLLNMLAFFIHQIFELIDELYQKCRKKYGSKKNLWECLRNVIRFIIFPDWETLLMRLLRPLDFL